MKGKTLICMSLSQVVISKEFVGIKNGKCPAMYFILTVGGEKLPDIQGVVSYPGTWGIPGSLPVRHKTRIAKRHLTWKGS